MILLQTDKRGRTKVTMFITVYLFEVDVRPYALNTYARERIYRFNEKLDEYTQLPLSVWNRLPLYDLVARRKRGFVGCHRIHGNVIFN